MTVSAKQVDDRTAMGNEVLLKQGERRQRWWLWLLNLPSAALIFVVLILPIVWLFWLSFFDAAGEPTVANNERLLGPVYVKTFVTTFQIAGVVTMACVLLGYPVAYMLSQVSTRTANILLICVVLPFWTSILVRTYAWLVILQRTGLINTWLLNTGLISEPLPLVHNFLGTVIGMVHIMLPFLILPLYVSMRAIDPILLRAAANCGASPFTAFRHVFLPLSLPGLAAGVGLVFVLCLGFFVTPEVLGGGRVQMWSMQIVDNVSVYGNWGAASALGVALLVATAVILWILRRALKLETIEGGR